jgi:hypothetical protein
MENFDLVVTKMEDDKHLWIMIDADYAAMVDKKLTTNREKWYILRSDEKKKMVLKPFNSLDVITTDIYLYRVKIAPIFSVHFAANISDFRKATKNLINKVSGKKKDYDLVTYLFWNFGYINDYKNHLKPETLSDLSLYLDEGFKL